MFDQTETHSFLLFSLSFTAKHTMKSFSAFTLGCLALALLACTAFAASGSATDSDPANLLPALEYAGADDEFSVLSVDAAQSRGIIASDRVTLRLLSAAGDENSRARAIFSWFATEETFSWRLSLFNIRGFTGAHLHYDPTGQIIQYLVPERPGSFGDYIEPIDIGRFGRVYRGSFDISYIRDNFGIDSISTFIRDYISDNLIYINVHGPNNEAILQGYLNA